MIKLIIPSVIVVAFSLACANGPAKRIAACEHQGESDGVCAAHEWNFAMETPFPDNDLSTLAQRVIPSH
ncbi:hypothetical protein RHD99_14055 [Buttiauxella selenatireducens]|uniref:Lipoprotein n=1 Tax=Buttiauxella selenatireducens TaxID=3073902 RepID=A0ABY9S510_9ENTR|nr:hypothetical protein [Buttiauxella sp. R73]WMY72603.1 hypothetical protein RHD99_14055 [Buttiauxella sp. R73]